MTATKAFFRAKLPILPFRVAEAIPYFFLRLMWAFDACECSGEKEEKGYDGARGLASDLGLGGLYGVCNAEL